MSVLKKKRESGNSILADFRSIASFFYIKKVPSYGNSFFFTIGVYLLALFGLLAITGVIMMVFGVQWGYTSGIGNFVRSVHLWAAEAFVTLIFLHLLVNFSTSMFRRRRLVWILGSAMLFLVLLEFAFGIALPNDFVAQVNARSGADLWNGMGLGFWINPLNRNAVLGWHIAVVPLLLVILMFTHYILVKKKGISTPYRKDIPYSMVAANHKAMYRRTGYIFAIILLFALLLPAPYSPPMTMQSWAKSSPNTFALTLLSEFNYSSGTATYLDTINPYRFSTREVYVTVPYDEYINATHQTNQLQAFLLEAPAEQSAGIAEAFEYFGDGTQSQLAQNQTGPLISVMKTLTGMAQSGIYGPVLRSESSSSSNRTYSLLLLSDSEAFDNETTENGLQVSQLGMLSIGNGALWQQYMMYWLLPYNIMEIATSGIPWWNDLQNGTVALIAFVLLMFLPYIPYLRDIPDRFKLYKLFWNSSTVPELRSRKGKGRKKIGV
jgi:ubiquinol-cytochrome c reductase cytochrome b subunit